MLALALGAVGTILPLLPTVPFIVLAAFCFARSSVRLECWLVEHAIFGPHIAAWRSRGAISGSGKRAAMFAFALSIAASLVALPLPWALAPVVAALVGGGWILSRPSA